MQAASLFARLPPSLRRAVWRLSCIMPADEGRFRSSPLINTSRKSSKNTKTASAFRYIEWTNRLEGWGMNDWNEQEMVDLHDDVEILLAAVGL